MAQTRAAQRAEGQPHPRDERRARVRFSNGQEVNCLPVMAAEKLQWSARILNISQGGVALSLGRRFEKGTLLTIEIQPPGNRFLDPLLARVVHVAAQPDGSWLVGCAFSREISEEDLQRLL